MQWYSPIENCLISQATRTTQIDTGRRLSLFTMTHFWQLTASKKPERIKIIANSPAGQIGCIRCRSGHLLFLWLQRNCCLQFGEPELFDMGWNWGPCYSFPRG